MDIIKAQSELQSTVETAIFEYERVTGDFIYVLEVRRKSELDFIFNVKSDANRESTPRLTSDGVSE